MERLTKREGKHTIRIGNEWRRHDVGWDKLAEYEDLVEQGCLFQLPIKIGDRVYRPVPKLYRTYTEFIVSAIIIKKSKILFRDNYGLEWNLNAIGKSIFLTKEETEQKLKEFKGE